MNLLVHVVEVSHHTVESLIDHEVRRSELIMNVLCARFDLLQL